MVSKVLCLQRKKNISANAISRPPSWNTEMPCMMSLLLLLWHDNSNNLFLTRSKVCLTKGHLMTWSSPRPGAVTGSRIECPIAILLNGNTVKISSKSLTFILIQLATFHRGQGTFYNFCFFFLAEVNGEIYGLSNT